MNTFRNCRNVFVRACACVCVFARVRACVCVCTHAFVRACVCACVHAYVRMSVFERFFCCCNGTGGGGGMKAWKLLLLYFTIRHWYCCSEHHYSSFYCSVYFVNIVKLKTKENKKLLPSLLFIKLWRGHALEKVQQAPRCWITNYSEAHDTPCTVTSTIKQ